MSEKQLKKIEELLSQVCEQQQAVCARLEQLESRVGGTGGAPTCEETVAVLDDYRAQEAHAVGWIGAWIDASDLPCVRGGLRTVQQREAFHAQLLEERIKELGGSCSAKVPKAERDEMMACYGDAKRSDLEKVETLLGAFGDIDAALKPLVDFADRLDADQETQYLLRTILQDEHSSVQFLKDAKTLLS